jgi:hypothetical protein
MRLKARLLVILSGLCCSALFAQHAVDPSQRYFRLICVVHLTGSGKKADPVRPEYAPGNLMDRHGIIAWTAQMSDDRKMAIVEYVAADRAAFAPILADKRPEIRVFEIGKTPPAAIEAALKHFKSDFKLSSLRVYAR